MKSVRRFGLAVALMLLTGTRAFAQSTASVAGVVVQQDSHTPVELARVEVEGTRLRAMTNERGEFRIDGVPSGAQVLIVSWVSTGGQRVPVQVPASGTVEVRVEYRVVPLALSGVKVSGASKVAQSVAEAPVAISVVDRVQARNYSSTGQFPQVFKGLPGMDVSANGVNDFNINARGFNTDLAQRMLVLMDGRDLAIPFTGSTEWSTLSLPLEDVERIEVVRGPGAALYGANAYNGVINLITPTARDVTGTKVSLVGGELATLKGDIRLARTFGANQQWGLRANLGFYRSDDWHLARTNVGDLEREYSGSVDTTQFPVHTPAPGFEVAPLFGQTLAGLPGPAVGTPKALQDVYGSARLDYYHANGALTTIEGGAGRETNQVFMTNVGRFQVDYALRPFARAAYASKRFAAMSYYSGRSSDQRSLASGAPIAEKSSIIHVESQWNASALDDRATVVVGASYRRNIVDSKGTLVASIDDARNDWNSGVFGQMKYAISPQLDLVAAARVDGANLYSTQFSPKAALVYSPKENQSWRASVGSAFQTPRMTNFFLHVPLGLPADLTQLEDGLRAGFGSALDAIPHGQLFTNTSAVPALALGNENLNVEHLTSFEVGYRGEFSRGVHFSADAYYSVVRDFVSALLPYANPAMGPWTAPASLDAATRQALEDAVAGALGAGSGLTRLNDAAATTAIVYSYGNAGRATEYGVELGAGIDVTKRLHLEGSYSYFGFKVDEGVALTPGDLIAPNTPKHKGGLRATYNAGRFDAWGAGNLYTAHEWSSGFFRGKIPSSQKIDAGLGYMVSAKIRIHAIATNLFDQHTYNIYGGSLDRRRVLAGMTGYF